MNQLLLICAVVALVALVGCGAAERIATKAKAEAAKAEARAAAEVKAARDAKVIEKAIRVELKKPEGELTNADLEKVTELGLYGKVLTEVPKGLEKLTQLSVLGLYENQLTSVKGLENLTQLKSLDLDDNQLTDVKALEKLNQLTWLDLRANPDLTKAQIDELQKALPNCRISSNSTK